MSSILSAPNLPEKKVSLVAVGDYPEIVAALHKEGIKTLSFRNENLSDEVSRHQDMIICHTDKNHIFLDPSQDKTILLNNGFSVTFSCVTKKNYPEDVKLNVAVLRDFFICNKKTCDTSLLEKLLSTGKKPVFVNQGYTKCSVCIVSENAIITEDEAIFSAVTKEGTDALLISKGDIYLSDKHYGFFGGCAGKLDKDILGVTGELKYHRDGGKILDFCKKHNVTIKELTKGRLTDIGGILPLKS